MNPTRRMQAALAVLAVATLSCGQASEGGTGHAGPTTTAASATSATTSVDPLVNTTTPGEVSAAGASPVTTTSQNVAAELPVVFTGHIECGPVVRTGVNESESDDSPVRERSRGWAWQPRATMTDPRLQGDYYISYDSNDYLSSTVTGVGTGTWRIENSEGAWQGSFTNIKYPDYTTIVSTALVGEGSYEGLTALWEATKTPNNMWPVCAWEVRGLIFEGDVPEAPEPYTGK